MKSCIDLIIRTWVPFNYFIVNDIFLGIAYTCMYGCMCINFKVVDLKCKCKLRFKKKY